MAINDYVGIPYVEDGLTPETGWNCWSCVVYVARHEFGIEYPGYSEQYSTPLDFDELDALIGHECRTNWVQVPFGRERGGDVIILRLRGLTHAGIVIRPGRMLHVHAGTQTVIEDYRRRQWVKRIDGFYRR